MRPPKVMETESQALRRCAAYPEHVAVWLDKARMKDEGESEKMMETLETADPELRWLTNVQQAETTCLRNALLQGRQLGPAQATAAISLEQLKAAGMIGLYASPGDAFWAAKIAGKENKQ